MSAAEIFAVFASGVAVATSIGSLAVCLATFVRDRPHIKVETSFAILTPSFDSVIQISVINDGRHSEIVSSVGLQTADQRQLILVQPESFPNGQPPWKLQPNESNMAIIPQYVLRAQCVEGRLGEIVYAFARTQSGRLYRNKPPRAVIDFVAGRSG